MICRSGDRGGKRGYTPFRDFIPHFFGFSFLDFGGGRVEAADFVGLFVGEDGFGEGFVG